MSALCSLFLICLLYYFFYFFFLMLRPPPSSTLFPYTTLFRSQVEDAVMRDEALEAVGVARDPVDHVPAEARARGAGVSWVDERQLFRGIGGAHDVVVCEAAPVAGDLLLELLAVSGGTVEVGLQDVVAARREHGCVPAHRPAVLPRALWAAVDEDQQRELRRCVRGADDERVDLAPVLRVHPDLLGGAEVQLPVLLVVEAREPRRLSAWPDGDDFGRPGQAGGGDDGRTVGSEIEVAPSRRHFAEAAELPVERDRVEPEPRLLQHGRDQSLAVAAPGKARDVVGVDVDGGDPARLPVLDLQLPLIGLVPVSRLRGPGEVAAVGRGPRLRVVAVVVRSEVTRRA